MSKPPKPVSRTCTSIVFAGHRIDEPGRAEPRFPADKEPRARELIRDALEKRQASGAKLKVLASAAPGSDIICPRGVQGTRHREHRLSADAEGRVRRASSLAISTTWRSRFLDLVDGQQPLS